MNKAPSLSPEHPSPGRDSDQRERETERVIDPAEIRELSRLSPVVSALHIALEWALVVGCATLAWRFWNPLLYLLAVAFIGARQHAMFVLIHEGAHRRLFPSHRVNDWVAEALLSWPFAIFRMRDYRRTHFAHHRATNGDGDPDLAAKRTPDWAFPMSPARLAWMLLLQVSGVGFVKFALTVGKMKRDLDRAQPQGREGPDERAMTVARPVFLAAAIVAIVASGMTVPVLLFWVVPFLTWLQLITRVRSIAEHFAIEGRDGVYAETRSTEVGWVERLFVSPKNINLHLEHHMFPSVPFYRLPELHRRLMGVPAFRRGAHVSRGYLGVLRECAGRGEKPAEAAPHRAPALSIA